jgi:hypothetical protein
MINVAEVLNVVPSFQRFCSVDALYGLVEALRGSSGFEVIVAGSSANGLPIHHVRFGGGHVKVLLVGFPHPNEPIGGMTAFSLLTLLKSRHRELINADVEWHVIPCIDPDGAVLNEGWTQEPFTPANYMRHFHRQEARDQVDTAFPIGYKRLVFDQPTAEASVLMGLLTQIRPDLYYSLHNAALGGGAWYCLSHDIGRRHYQLLYNLLDQYGIPLQVSRPLEGLCSQFGEGILGHYSAKRTYDFLERTVAQPEELMQHGALSWDYLAEIKESAISLITELPYVRHPSDRSKVQTGESHRHLLLREDAENKYIATLIFEEWEKVKMDLDAKSPFYRKTFIGVISGKDTLHEGLTSWQHKTRDILFNPRYSRTMTEGERFNVHLERFFILCQQYEFVRLLRASTQTERVRGTTERLEPAFGEALDAIAQRANFEAFEVVCLDDLVRVQLGSGLIVLNSLLAD